MYRVLVPAGAKIIADVLNLDTVARNYWADVALEQQTY